jgi:hypothetical protein
LKEPLGEGRGVDKFFKTLAKLAIFTRIFTGIFTRQIRQLAKFIERVSEGKKNLSPDWRMGFYFYSPILNSAFYWHLASWRVDIRTPGELATRENVCRFFICVQDCAVFILPFFYPSIVLQLSQLNSLP